VLVDGVQLIDVDVERAPGLRALPSRDHPAHALLEGGLGVEAAQGVVAALDDAECLAPEDLGDVRVAQREGLSARFAQQHQQADEASGARAQRAAERSEEHTSELQSLRHLVCRLLLENKKKAR